MPSLALGTSPVKPIEMVNAYSMFANGGKEVKPTFIRRIMDHEGNILYDAHLESKQVLDKSKAFVMEEMMTGMFNKKLSGYLCCNWSIDVIQTIKNICRQIWFY